MNLSSFPRFLLLLLAMLCGQASYTSVRAQEVQVAFDAASDSATDARIFTITRELRNELDLFPEHPNFEQAMLYRQAPGRYSLEISVLEDGRTTRVTSILDSAQLDALRSDIRSRVGVQKPASLIDQSGRSHFLWTTATAAFFYYGPAFAANVGGDVSGVAGSYLLGGGLGFFLPYLITENSRMTDGMAAGARVGAILGIVHTALIFGVTGAFDDDRDGLTFYGVSALASAAELAAGAVLANKYDVGAGRANLIGVGGVFGTTLGVEAAIILLGGDVLENESPAALTGAGLIGSIGGMYWANEVAKRTNYTTGDAKAVMMGGITGSLVSSAILLQIVDEDPGDVGTRLMFGVLAGGTLGGAYAAHKMLGRRNFSDGDGNLVILGTGVGFLVGSGFATMSSGGPETVLLPAVGAAAGFALMMNTLGEGTEDRSLLGTDNYERYGDAGLVDKQRKSTLMSRMEFNFNPLAFGMAAANIDLQHNASRVNALPLAGMTVRL
ncbi:MAG TPA: hypothetical protein VFH43_11950 [Candidatus Kapabacteria bacterium]|nr:hypothetical protein [Candidatus Kapabacteria bacterium]